MVVAVFRDENVARAVLPVIGEMCVRRVDWQQSWKASRQPAGWLFVSSLALLCKEIAETPRKAILCFCATEKQR